MFKYSGKSIAIKWDIDTRGQKVTGIAHKPKALTNPLRANLRKLVEKGAPGLHKGFFFEPISSETVSLI